MAAQVRLLPCKADATILHQCAPWFDCCRTKPMLPYFVSAAQVRLLPVKANVSVLPLSWLAHTSHDLLRAELRSCYNRCESQAKPQPAVREQTLFSSTTGPCCRTVWPHLPTNHRTKRSCPASPDTAHPAPYCARTAVKLVSAAPYPILSLSKATQLFNRSDPYRCTERPLHN